MLTSFNENEAVETHVETTGLLPVEAGIFSDYLSTPGRLLNLGCGNGRISRHLSDLGHKVVGVDAPDMVGQVRCLYPDIEFRVGEASELVFKDGVFDYVVYGSNGLDYLYPMQKRVDALNEINRVLRPGGCFIYNSHDQNSLFIPTLRRINHIRYFDGPYHTERTAVGDMVTYFGTVKNNLSQLKVAGFDGFVALPQERASWRYFVTWKKD